MSFGIIPKTLIEFSAPLVTVFIHIILVLCSVCNIEITLTLMGIGIVIEVIFIVTFYTWHGKSGVNNSNHVILFLFYKVFESALLWQVLSLILTKFIPMVSLTPALLIVMCILYGLWLFSFIAYILFIK